MIELQYDAKLGSSPNYEAWSTFYAPLRVSRFSELHKLSRNLTSVFGSTHTCEQALSHMKR